MIDKDFVFKLADMDLSDKVMALTVTGEVTFSKVITTLDGVEHPYPARTRKLVTVDFGMLTEDEATEIYTLLNERAGRIGVGFEDPTNGGAMSHITARVTSNIELVFKLVSIDGKRRYRGGSLEFREL